MKPSDQAVRLFFTSQHFADGLRTTVAVLLPALIASFFNQLETGVLFSLGALCVSITDTPGAIVNRTNTMLFCLVFVLLTALITLFARQNDLTMALLVLVLSFFYSMFLVYGARGGSVGSAALLVMVLTMDDASMPPGPPTMVLYILLGGIWYTVISLLAYHARPFRMAQRSLGECVQELARFLRIKADFYDCNKNLENSYRRLVSQQMIVSEKQDAVREILYKTRQIVRDSSTTGRRLLLAFTDTVDFFEETTASFYDYRQLRQNYADTGVLNEIAALARSMANELEIMGIAMQTNGTYRPRMDFDAAIRQLKQTVDAARLSGDQSSIILKKLLVNIRRMMQRMEDLRIYFATDRQHPPKDRMPLERFVSHQSLEPGLFFSNLNFGSQVFRFSLRVAIAALVAFLISKFVIVSTHSYWILMTTIYMLKPSFGFTRKRNIERIGGTLAGGVVGVLILIFIKDKQVLFALMVIFMLGTYSLIRVRYLLAVCFMTPFLLIFFALLGMGVMQVIQERVVDTLLGCLIALAAGYLLFPTWESTQVNTYLRNMLKANSNYLFRVAELFAGKQVSMADYKLARKDVYVSSANLSSAFQRMLSEPKKTRKHSTAVQQFVVLNHILFSNTATLASMLRLQPVKTHPAELTRAVKKLLLTLCGTLERMDTPCKAGALESVSVHEESHAPLTADEVLLKKQLEFMQRLGEDIAKVTEQVIEK